MNLRSYALFRFIRINTAYSLLGLLLLCSVSAIVAHAQAPAKDARKVVQRVEPEYPDFFRNGHFQARVVAEATVLANGSVSRVEVKSGNPMFAEYASKALMRWKYAPAPAQTVESVTFNFNSAH